MTFFVCVRFRNDVFSSVDCIVHFSRCLHTPNHCKLFNRRTIDDNVTWWRRELQIMVDWKCVKLLLAFRANAKIINWLFVRRHRLCLRDFALHKIDVVDDLWSVCFSVPLIMLIHCLCWFSIANRQWQWSSKIKFYEFTLCVLSNAFHCLWKWTHIKGIAQKQF